jgi:hypothetical protein
MAIPVLAAPSRLHRESGAGCRALLRRAHPSLRRLRFCIRCLRSCLVVHVGIPLSQLSAVMLLALGSVGVESIRSCVSNRPV